MNQQDFLRAAKRELGLSYPGLAEEIGVASRTVEKWAMSETSPDHRPMPLMARRFILRLLDERKRERLAQGDRAAAETIDAIGAQADRERRERSLRTFDTLQRNARRLMGSHPVRPKPDFRSFSEKNRWEREEEVRHARHIRAKAARIR
jgi:transcriptional regulator with XRE-family HTH domain